jgi:hypothetical protein
MNTNNDFKVVTLKNISDFEFTPVLGAMYDGRPIFGKTGKSIEPGEELQFPYHVGHRIATNLAKQILVREIPAPVYGKGDPAQSPAGNAISDERINELVGEILVGQYTEEKPIQESETEMLMKKFEELNKTVESLTNKKETPDGFKDKQEVIAELEKREIQHDKRKSKDELEKLLA